MSLALGVFNQGGAMQITISAPHCTVPEPIRQQAEALLGRLARFEPRLFAIDVCFDLDHGRHRVEARLSVAGGPLVVAHGAGESFRVALDRVVERLARQLRRRRDRRRERGGNLSPAGGV
jgi:ribosomal subunit interface protein